MQASLHHIGLALEPGFSINNNIALSNKLFTYLLAGNAVILSSTPAQELFYRQYPQTGWCYSPGDIEGLVHIIEQAYHDEPLLTGKRQQAWKLANTILNWENEQQQLLALVKATI
jgi:glycosyltransferase involved in cell wall biosynthesis